MEDWVTGLSWLHIGLLSALPLALLPILIHWWGQRGGSTIALPTTFLLADLDRRARSWEQIRKFLLLLLRMIALLALVVAVARPLPPHLAQAPTGEAQQHLFVIDATASMRYVTGGKTLYDRAIERIKDGLRALPPQDGANIMWVGNRMQLLSTQLTRDRQSLVSALSAQTVSDRSQDLSAMLESALSAEEQSLIVWVVSDFGRSSWPQEPELPAELTLRKLGVAPRELANLAIEAAHSRASAQDNREVVVEVELLRSGVHPRESRNLRLLRGETVLNEVAIKSTTGERWRQTLRARLPAGGHHSLRVELFPKDDYPFDDDYLLSFFTQLGTSVLVINGAPSSTPYDDEIFFLEKALRNVPVGQPSLDVTVADISQLDDLLEQTDRFEVLWLANVRALDPLLVQAIDEKQRAGLGVIVSVGDQVDFEAYNRSMAPLLPRPLRDRHRSEDDDAGTQALHSGLSDGAERVLSPALLTSSETYLQQCRHRMVQNLAPGPPRGAGTDQRNLVIARYDNGTPMVLADQRPPAGRRMLITTSIDAAWSDWALRPGFVALSQQLLRWAGGTPSPRAARTLEQYEVIELSDANRPGRHLIDPSGQAESTQRLRADRVGIYEWRNIPDGPAIAHWAVNSQRRESDFSVSTQADDLSSTGADNPRSIAAVNELGTQTRGYAYVALVLLLLSFVLESWLAARG